MSAASPLRRARPLLLLAATFALGACGEDEPDTEPPPDSGEPDTWIVADDGDGDGVTLADGDCDDTDPAVHPGQDETCNGVDENCNGLVDEGSPDSDADGTPDCLDAEDCDGLDNDGDGSVDEAFPDTDLDGTADCLDAEGCDGLDNDGDLAVDEGFDADDDGWTTCGTATRAPDCDDGDPATYPTAPDDPDDRDNDCDGLIDEGSWRPGDLVLTEVMVNPAAVADPDGEWIEVRNASGRDVRLDGLAIVSSAGAEVAVIQGTAPLLFPAGSTWILALSADPARNGGVPVDATFSGARFANEADDVALVAGDVTLDSLTWDDGATMPDLEGATLSLDPWFVTADANDAPTTWCAAPDRWAEGTDRGSPGFANPSCPTFDHDGDGISEQDGDCDDANPTIFPGAIEAWYDGMDTDCDAWSDLDADYDGHDAAAWGGDDCDDDAPTVNPSETEVCDDLDVDEDCNGTADDDDPGATGQSPWYRDVDLDLYGDDDATWSSCNVPVGFVAAPGDCEDGLPEVNPLAAEVCGDGLDNDCDNLAIGCGLVGTVPAETAVATILGTDRGAQLGISVSIAGDLDADGLADLVIGASGASDGGRQAGAAYILHGPTSGEDDVTTLATSWWNGTATAELAGSSVAGVGDTNLDGFDDVLVGAPGYTGALATTGGAWLLLGPISATGSTSLSGAIDLPGESRDDMAGAAVAGAGDVDGDGNADLLVGAYMDDDGGRDAGAAYLLYGPVTTSVRLSAADAKLTGVALTDLTGLALAGPGDIDGDGFDDVLVGAPQADARTTDSGKAFLVRGPVTGTVDLSAADVCFAGTEANSNAGRSVAAAGDVDADGYRDLLVGIPNSSTGASGGGATALFLGPVTATGDVLTTTADGFFYGVGRGWATGTSLSGGGDLDDDGFDDIAIGGPRAGVVTPPRGNAWVIYGPATGVTSLSDADATLVGGSDNEQFGAAHSLGGDVDGDGFDDLLVGAPAAGGSGQGTVRLFGGGVGL